MTKIQIRKVNGVPMGREKNPYPFTHLGAWECFEQSVTSHPAPGCSESDGVEGDLQLQELDGMTHDWVNTDNPESHAPKRQIWVLSQKVEVKEVDNSADNFIAEFMGLKCIKDENSSGDEWEWLPTPEHSNWCFKSPPPYNRSWSWLIPVCSKCNDIIQSQERPSRNHCNDLDWLECEISTALREYEIGKVHIAVCNFIIAYNKKTLLPPTH